jgi:MFS family permease
LVYAVLGSYAVNFVIPRAGELWRCSMVSKQEKIPFQKLFGTIVIDRLVDMVMVGLFVLTAFVCNLNVFSENRAMFHLPDWIVSSGLYIGLALAAILSIIIFILFRNHRIVQKIRNFIIDTRQDMIKVWQMKGKIWFLFYTFGIWIFYFFYFYITFYAFNFTTHLGIVAGLFVFSMGSLSMFVPSNGGLGPWQAAIVFGLCVYMVHADQAKAFATVVFAFQSIWVAACGLFGIVMLAVGKEKLLPEFSITAKKRKN